VLPAKLKPLGFDTWQKEEWEQYRVRLNLPNHEAVLQFYRQVVYDHFEHFNDHYPSFALGNHEVVMREYMAQEATDLIRFFKSEPMDWWAEQYDEYARKNQDYIIFQTMSTTLTFPFPPVLIDPRQLKNRGRNECGRPLHLVEGTHRVSYLRHMLAKGIVPPSSKHKFVVLTPHGTDA
jgi:hypothetical protein